ncbi:MAG: rod shape-determining protein MreD [Gammaproteobacteria bacterium]|nr:rod shape-determining protein MreD [Gammaproteobacteria bacterium]
MNSTAGAPNRVYLALCVSCFAAFTLMLVQVPDWLAAFWPDWIALVLVYWALLAPNKVGPIVGFTIGTMLEVLTAKTFGVLSIGLATLVFLVNLTYLQLKVTSRWLQVFLVVALIAFFKLINLWLEGLVAGNKITVEDWYSIVGNILVWPFVNIVLEEIRRVFHLRP